MKTLHLVAKNPTYTEDRVITGTLEQLIDLLDTAMKSGAYRAAWID